MASTKLVSTSSTAHRLKGRPGSPVHITAKFLPLRQPPTTTCLRIYNCNLSSDFHFICYCCCCGCWAIQLALPLTTPPPYLRFLPLLGLLLTRPPPPHNLQLPFVLSAERGNCNVPAALQHQDLPPPLCQLNFFSLGILAFFFFFYPIKLALAI